MPQSLRNIHGQTSCNYYFNVSSKSSLMSGHDIATPGTAEGYGILHFRVRHIATFHHQTRHIASPDTAYCSPHTTYCSLHTAYCITGYGILYLCIRHIVSVHTTYCSLIRHIASPDTAYCSRIRHIVSLHTAYCISAYGILHHRIRHCTSAYGILHIRIQHYGMLILSTIPLHMLLVIVSISDEHSCYYLRIKRVLSK